MRLSLIAVNIIGAYAASPQGVPINTMPAFYATDTATPLTLSGLSVFDVDSIALTIELNVSAGTITATSSGGVSVSGSGTSTITLSGNEDDLNAWLSSGAAPVFSHGTAASVTLTMTTTDAFALSDIDTRTITVTDPASSDEITTDGGVVITDESLDALRT